MDALINVVVPVFGSRRRASGPASGVGLGPNLQKISNDPESRKQKVGVGSLWMLPSCSSPGGGAVWLVVNLRSSTLRLAPLDQKAGVAIAKLAIVADHRLLFVLARLFCRPVIADQSALAT
jgi:hypothetical protein